MKQMSQTCPVAASAGLPPTGSWQDLKDHMREAGDVCFADVQRDGEGVVEFLRREDMEYALRRLDNTEFRSHQVRAVLNTHLLFKQFLHQPVAWVWGEALTRRSF